MSSHPAEPHVSLGETVVENEICEKEVAFEEIWMDTRSVTKWRIPLRAGNNTLSHWDHRKDITIDKHSTG